MAIIGLTLGSTKDYQSIYDSEKGSADATVFVLGTLDSRIMGKIRDLATTVTFNSPTRMSDEAQTTINSNEVAFNTVLYGLRGWKNFKDAKGNDIPFTTLERRHSGALYNIADPEIIKTLPTEIIQELAEQIRSANEVKEVDAKN